jgi:hypothetical protein
MWPILKSHIVQGSWFKCHICENITTQKSLTISLLWYTTSTNNIILQEMGQNIKEFLENWQFLELLMDLIAEICEVKIETWLWLSIFRV